MKRALQLGDMKPSIRARSLSNVGEVEQRLRDNEPPANASSESR